MLWSVVPFDNPKASRNNSAGGQQRLCSKNYLFDQRHVVEVLRFVPHVRGGIDARKGAKVMNEVRLIEVAAGKRDICPVNLACNVNKR